ncbi:tRNA (guanine-N(7)-)-methyltransferase [Syntrophobotulus glycolicus DSM 8271]|uniref:tRNA (guanine-N(7)-)-methyltransferase n=1 Tax=Syntrophobotulus glycolicus (strain DSM 8271 / FlGlyR) TaxID=645991 RepID=F0T2V5_SYNGF|nr:tRNA (guanosine(46)-N7)-methyltransferase TrmB [Syntrophobotulus glycolicus]ADY57592.1 tRNA (guanine-N(7)-)-methyltransferase [Syntrophobotulus glycolicus DSM 8271]
MRLRKKWWARPEMEKDYKVIFAPAELAGKWREVFGNHYPIHLELGCGRGSFITRLAQAQHRINYIAVDMQDEVLVYALRKLNETGLENVRIVPLNIEKIGEVFAPGEIGRIYLNFSTPWPKKRHHKRRLTHPNFLKQYQAFLKEPKEIWLKTDNEPFFLDSLDYLREQGFKEEYKTFDLHGSDFRENIMTEYEEKFARMGITIKFGIFKE